MPRTDDQSPGDARQPYSGQGGPEGRHAQTHDVRREEATRPKAHPQDQDEFIADLGAERSGGGHVDESILASDDKELRTQMPAFGGDDLKRISILTVGTPSTRGAPTSIYTTTGFVRSKRWAAR